MARAGRPREFVEDAVLDAAAELFWERGFAATSLADVSAATGLGRQSLYNAFGDKRGIFLSALDRYRDHVLARFLAPLEAPEAGLAELRSALLRLARRQAREQRRGCLLLNSSMELGPDDAEVRDRTQDHMRRLRRASQAIVERACADGLAASGPESVDAKAAAESVVALTLGLHLMARAGASERAMGDAVEGALARLGATNNGQDGQEV